MEFEIPKSKSKAEELYILRRRIKAFGNSICFYLCRIFPIDNKLVSVCTFEGKGGFGCNPKYIVQELHNQRPDLKIVWFVNKDAIEEKIFPEYIKKVPNTLWSRAYWLTRSNVWIDNYRKPYGTVKRRGQYYLNTNHYTLGIKTVGLWRGPGFSKMAYLVSRSDSKMIDDLIIDSNFCEEMCPRGLLYSGNLLKIGAPRCDILNGNRYLIRKQYRENIGIEVDAKIVMFAPTFREGARNGVRSVYSESWSIDFKSVIEALEKRFGGKWYLCVRVHPQLAKVFGDYVENGLETRIINESKSDDMYKILAACDAYITDYSSACFEAGLARIPVFICADDIDKYTRDRGALFWDFENRKQGIIQTNSDIFKNVKVNFPFPVTETNSELIREIEIFDEEKYEQSMSDFEQKLEMIFDSRASKRAVDNILKWIR